MGFITTEDETNVDDEVILDVYHNGSVIAKDVDFIDFSGTAIFSISEITSGVQVILQSEGVAGSGTRLFELAFTDLNSGFVKNVSSHYKVLASFRFPGTVEVGSPLSIKLDAAKQSQNWSARIYDVTNGEVVAEVTNQSNSEFALVSVGTLSNLSTGEARWEIQGKRIKCAGMSIIW